MRRGESIAPVRSGPQRVSLRATGVTMPLLRFGIELVLWTSGLVGAGIALMLTFILARRLLRRRHFLARDRARQRLEPLIVDLSRGAEPSLEGPLSELEREVLKVALLTRLDENPQERAAIVRFFERCGFIDRELALFGSWSAWRRARAAMTLGRMRSPQAILVLVDALEDPASDVRLAAVRSLGLIGSSQAAAPLVRLLLAATLRVPPSAMLPALVACCRDRPGLLVDVLATAADNSARIAAAAALAEISTPMIRGQLEPFLHDADPEVRARMATAIGQLRDWAALNSLVGLVDDPVWFVRLRAVEALGKIGDWRGLPALLKAIQDEHWQVRSQVAQILGRHGWLAGSVIDAVEQSGDRYAWQALISEFERAGLVWKAIGNLHAEEPGQRAEAHTVVASAIRAGALRAAIHAVETHPEPEIRLEVAGLLRACLRPEDRPLLVGVARSPGLAPAVRQVLEQAASALPGTVEMKPVRG